MLGLFIRETFRQGALVRRFLGGDFPSVGDFKSALFLSELESDRSRPDHYYRNSFKPLCEGWDSWQDVIRGTLDGLSSTFLEPGGRSHICVRYDRFGEWQNVLAETSPLAVVAWRLWSDSGPLPFSGSSDDLSKAIQRIVAPQVRHSALPTVQDSRLDHLIAREGLDDLHVHFNGSSEMERVWLDTMDRPLDFIKVFNRGARNSLVVELLGQCEAGLTHAEFAQRIRIASRLQRLLVRLTMPALLVPGDPDRLAAVAAGAVRRRKGFNWQELLTLQHPGIEDVDCDFLPKPPHLDRFAPLSIWPAVERGHPLAGILPPLPDGEAMPPLMAEAVLLMAAYQRLEDEDGEVIAVVLFLYLSLMCLFARVIVQQRDQIGFDQFQKITLSQVRERLETDTYVDRLRQAEYTPNGDIDVLEGRFAPKDTAKGCSALLKKIDQSYDLYLRQASSRRIDLRLVVHFVKTPDDRGVTLCRHYRLRRSLERQARSIMAVMERRNGKKNCAPIVGFDAAANELHAWPEVFAPIFRSLRRHGHGNFTYHAGEDFLHLASGIRAVVEAVRFLNFTPGNRIGHGTALGIDPQFWLDHIGQSLTLSAMEWLDNLVFARDILMRMGAIQLAMGLERGIVARCSRIYGQSHSAEMLMRAWDLRHLDPLVALGANGLADETLDPLRQKEFTLVEEAKKGDAEAFALWRSYHEDSVYRRGAAMITLDREDFFSAEMLGLMQEYALEEMRKRRLVLEALPTSNVRISFYNSHREHHILRWLGISGKAAGVPVVLGSDDPGIFATNMRNEYSHLLRELDEACPDRLGEVYSYLEMLVRNGKMWRFKPP